MRTCVVFLEIFLVAVFLLHHNRNVEGDDDELEDYESQNDSCPANFTEYNDLCYQQLEEVTQCPYPLPSPLFDESDTFLLNLTQVRIAVERIEEYDYFQWKDIRGNYGKLFTKNLSGDEGDYVSLMNDTNYERTDNSIYPRICAYDKNAEPNNTYCGLYDFICSREILGSINVGVNTINCHCYNQTTQQFCQLSCDKKLYNRGICELCERNYALYKTPAIKLQLNKRLSQIFVSVTSYRKLQPLQNAMVHCFTDAAHSLHDVTYRFDFSVETLRMYNDSYKNVHYLFLPIQNSSGHYWCRAFRFDEEIIQSKTIIVENFEGQAFTMNVTIDDTSLGEYPLEIHEKLLEELQNYTSYTIRFLHLYPREMGNSTLSYRFYVEETNASMEDLLEETYANYNSTYAVTLSPSYCLSGETTIEGVTLTWPETNVGVTVLPSEMCLQNNSIPVTRTCLGEFLYGTYWSDVNGTCDKINNYEYGSNETENLHNLADSTIPTQEKIRNLQNLDPGKNYISLDAHLIVSILKNATIESANASDVVKIISNFMDIHLDTLKEAQKLLNSTDLALGILDNLMETSGEVNETIWNEDYFHLSTNNIHIQVTSFNRTNITGAALYKSNGGYKIRPVDKKMDANDIFTDELIAAAYFSETQLLQVRNLDISNPRLIVIFFMTNALFNQQNAYSPLGIQVGFYIPEFNDPFLYDYVKVLLNPPKRYRGYVNCYSWNYGIDRALYNTRGSWEMDTFALPAAKYYLCRYPHITHFGMLIGVGYDLGASIVAIIGCVLSSLGGCGVIATAIVHQSWTEQSSTKLLLNFVVILLLQNVVYSISGSVDGIKNTEIICVFMGALLHYCVGLQFSWMLIIGYLQYQRFVVVFYTPGRRFVIKSCVISYILPAIPVLLVLIIDKNEYVQDDYCYLLNQPLYFAVLLPVTIVMVINLIIFAIIVKNVFCKKKDDLEHGNLLHLRLLILLYFLLGFYWIFGIMAGTLRSIALNFLFCMSAALQGVVLFLYYIAFNKMIRDVWMRKLRQSELMGIRQIWMQKKRKLGKIKIKYSESNKTV